MRNGLDAAVGNALEHLVRVHHRRRMQRLGHGGVLAPEVPEDLWVPGPRPPRPGNDVRVLIDGREAFSEIATAIRGARSHVHVTGWHLSPGLRLTRAHGDGPTVGGLLAEVAERADVRVLLWAGPPIPAFQPTRRMMKDVRNNLTAAGRIRCVLDARERTLHCHHEKVVVVDDRVAFVGGLDMSDLSGDRWDSNDHPPRDPTGWHDVTLALRGPVVADVAHHFRDRWQEVAEEQLPMPGIPDELVGGVPAQFLRTVPESTYGFAPRGEFSILDAYHRALRSARRFVYLENQFLWSAEITQVLGDLLREPPADDFRVVLVLPARPSSGRDTTRGQLGLLMDADDGHGRLSAATIRAPRSGDSASLYVHAKVGIIDDEWLTVGSANLNEHSLFNDTEANVLVRDPDLARSTRIRLWSEHLECDPAELEGPVSPVIDGRWRPRLAEQGRRDEQGLPATRRLTALTAVSRRTERLLGPTRGLLVDA
ncbi:phospholipase [Nakamurella sp. YIM 132087]|uniref:Phospholipase n=1 Tax=Nakamurella alba TaxID=2665158 RepID=A0A7K1FH58_9ACTN|nr:phospholipase D family protein [Nakamurella alba]MTD12623.1 phospholipase [Nakamurella alba]